MIREQIEQTTSQTIEMYLADYGSDIPIDDIAYEIARDAEEIVLDAVRDMISFVDGNIDEVLDRHVRNATDEIVDMLDDEAWRL